MTTILRNMRDRKVKLKKDKKGFTLIELIIVITIIGILAAISIPRLGSFSDSAKDAAVQAEHRVLIGAVQMYQLDNDGAYPTALSELDQYIQGGTASLENDKDGNPAHKILTSGTGDDKVGVKLVSDYLRIPMEVEHDSETGITTVLQEGSEYAYDLD